MKLKNRATRFAIFCRVSTRDQLTGYSLETQEQDARVYVQRAGGTVEKVYTGQESATRKQEDRAILQTMLADADRGMFDALVIQETSRLSRNLGVMISTIEKLVERRIALHDFSGPVPYETSSDEFVTGVKVLAGRYQSRQSVEKSLRSRLHIMRSGAMAAGRPPFGRRWVKDQKTFDVIPEKLRLLQSAYDLIVNRRKSLAEAARRLNIAAVSLRKAIDHSARTKFTQRLSGETFTFECPALLTTFEQARLVKRIAENRIVRPQVRGEFLLQGLVRCAACNGHMTGQSSIKGEYRYSVYRHPPATYKDGCTWQVPRDLLDDDVLTACAETVKSGKALRDAIKAELTHRHGTAEPKLEQRRDELKRSIGKYEKQVDDLMDALGALGKRAPERAKETTLKRLRRLDEALTSDKADLEKAEADLAEMQIPPLDADQMAAKVRSLYWASGGGAKATLTLEQRRLFVRTIIGIAPELGVFVQMHRHKGGSKKAVFWKYQINGLVASASNFLNPATEPAYPKVCEISLPKGKAIKELAAVAGATRGIHDVATHTKVSSGASPRCG